MAALPNSMTARAFRNVISKSEEKSVTYTEIFREIGSIMAYDSATYPDFGAGDYVLDQIEAGKQ